MKTSLVALFCLILASAETQASGPLNGPEGRNFMPIFMQLRGASAPRVEARSATPDNSGAARPVVKVTDYGAKGDARIVTDGTIRAGSTVFRSASASFRASDVGKRIGILGAAPGGFVLTTNIAAVLSQSELKLSTPASTTVAGAWAALGTDDTAAIQAASDRVVNAGGGTVVIPAGTYVTSRAVVVDSEGVTVASPGNISYAGVGDESLVVFLPSRPFIASVNDRAFVTDRGHISARRAIANPITAGAGLFTAASAGDTADLSRGDWLIVAEYDEGAGDVVIIEWVQVASVSGAVVKVQRPFRVAFPNARRFSASPVGGLGFTRVTRLTENVNYSDFKIIQPDVGTNHPSISITYSRRVMVDNVSIDNPNGQALYSYQSADVTIRHSRTAGNNKVANEFASTVDLLIYRNTLGEKKSVFSKQPKASAPGLNIDFGTAFFFVIGNQLPQAGNIAIEILNGAHDGMVKRNTIGWVRDAGIKDVAGLCARGMRRVHIADNVFAGGDGRGSVGISTTATAGQTVEITSEENILERNETGRFSRKFGVTSAKKK